MCLFYRRSRGRDLFGYYSCDLVQAGSDVLELKFKLQVSVLTALRAVHYSIKLQLWSWNAWIRWNLTFSTIPML